MGQKTDEKIKEVAFRLFLEQGYEGTNQREIAELSDSTVSSLYFYFTSKKDLFLKILDESWQLHIDTMKTMIQQEDLDLHQMFKQGIHSVQGDYATYRFILRYRLFPVYELAAEIRQIYQKWETIEKEIYLIPVQKYLASLGAKDGQQAEMILYHFMRMKNCLMNDMIISGEYVNNEKMEMHWNGFCSYLQLDEK